MQQMNLFAYSLWSTTTDIVVTTIDTCMRSAADLPARHLAEDTVPDHNKAADKDTEQQTISTVYQLIFHITLGNVRIIPLELDLISSRNHHELSVKEEEKPDTNAKVL